MKGRSRASFLRAARGGQHHPARIGYLPKLTEGGIDFEFYTVGGDEFMFT
jgi:hypothetical protein